MRFQTVGHRLDGHRHPRVPEQVGQGHEARARLQPFLEGLEHVRSAAGLLDWKTIDGEVVTSGQLEGCGHHPRMLGIGEQ